MIIGRPALTAIAIAFFAGAIATGCAQVSGTVGLGSTAAGHGGSASMIGTGGTSEHEYAGRRLILLGANFSLFRVWDGVRGIDYLMTRPEVDPERIGCCGQSGGGTLTQFLAALDNRIRAAVVSEGNTENLAHAEVEPRPVHVRRPQPISNWPPGSTGRTSRSGVT